MNLYAGPARFQKRAHITSASDQAAGSIASAVLCIDQARLSLCKAGSRGPGVKPAAIQFPARGKHLSHQCRGDREEASPLQEAARFCWLRPSALLMAAPRCQVGSGPAAARPGDHKSPEEAARAPWQRPSVAARTRPLLPCQMCREADRQRAGMLALLSARPMLIVRKRPPAVGPGAFPNPPPRAWGPRRSSTEVPGPVLRAGPDVDTRPTSPRGITQGTEVACGPSSPRRTARGSNYAGLIRHSVGQKVANDWNIAGMPQFGHYAQN
jgi:hypothetical protein